MAENFLRNTDAFQCDPVDAQCQGAAGPLESTIIDLGRCRVERVGFLTWRDHRAAQDRHSRHGQIGELYFATQQPRWVP